MDWRELKQVLGFIVDKNCYYRLVWYAIHDYQHFRWLWHLYFKDNSKTTLMMEAADSSETLVNLYLTFDCCLGRQFLPVNCSHSKCLSLQIVTLTFHCILLQSELTAVKADRYHFERSAGNFGSNKCGGEAEGHWSTESGIHPVAWQGSCKGQSRDKQQIQTLTADCKWAGILTFICNS